MEEKLKEWFVKNMRMPISVFEDPYWDFYIDLYEKRFGSRTKWTNFYSRYKEMYKSQEEFLSDYYKRRELILSTVKEKTDSRGVRIIDDQFNSGSLVSDKSNPISPYYDISFPWLSGLPKKDIYNMANDHKRFLSLDLRKANFQAMNFYNPELFIGEMISPNLGIDDIYNKWLDTFEDKNTLIGDCVRESKYLREVVFGNIGPSRAIRIEKWMISNVASICKDRLETAGLEYRFAQLGSDEVVIEVGDIDSSIIGELEKDMRIVNKVDIKAEIFTVEGTDFVTESGSKVDAFIKKHVDGKIEYKKVNRHYYPQVYEELEGIEPDPYERDLLFNQEGELARFMHRIKRK
jgi:hypothetical protein